MKRDVRLDLYIYKVSEKRPTLYAALENCEGDKQSRWCWKSCHNKSTYKISIQRDVRLDLYIYNVYEKRPTLYAALENGEADKQFQYESSPSQFWLCVGLFS